MASLLMYFHLANTEANISKQTTKLSKHYKRERDSILNSSHDFSASDLPDAISSFDDNAEWLVTEPILSPLANVVESLSAFGRQTDFSASSLHVVMQLKPISEDNFWTSSTYISKRK